MFNLLLLLLLLLLLYCIHPVFIRPHCYCCGVNSGCSLLLLMVHQPSLKLGLLDHTERSL
jgi:hypothetical protein